MSGKWIALLLPLASAFVLSTPGDAQAKPKILKHCRTELVGCVWVPEGNCKPNPHAGAPCPAEKKCTWKKVCDDWVPVAPNALPRDLKN